MTAAARSENLRIPLSADGREICLHFRSKGDCIRSCTSSHAPLRVHTREAVIRYIRVDSDFMDPSRNINFNGGGDWGSHGGHCERSGGNGTINSEEQNRGNGVGFSVGRSGHSGGKDGNNGGGRGA